MDATFEFRTRLRDALSRRRMSQTELARQLSVRVATVNEWLNRGTMPSGPVMLRLPGILGVDGHWLLTGEQRPPAGSEYLAPSQRERATTLLQEALQTLQGEEEPSRTRDLTTEERRALGAAEAYRQEQNAPAQKRRGGRAG